MPHTFWNARTQSLFQVSSCRRPFFQYSSKHAICRNKHVNSLVPKAVSTAKQRSLQSVHLLSSAPGRHRRQGKLYATTTAEQRKSHFTYSPDQLSAMAEDMLDGKKQSVSDQELLAGLASSEARGLSDNSEQASERRSRFGVNKLPSRKDVRASTQKGQDCYFGSTAFVENKVETIIFALNAIGN